MPFDNFKYYILILVFYSVYHIFQKFKKEINFIIAFFIDSPNVKNQIYRNAKVQSHAGTIRKLLYGVCVCTGEDHVDLLTVQTYISNINLRLILLTFSGTVVVPYTNSLVLYVCENSF